MNRNQFIAFAGKLNKMALQLEADARRVQVSGHPGNELADAIREQAAGIRRIAKLIESEFG